MAMGPVNIRGMGIFGLSVAWACARRGVPVRMWDPVQLAARTSGGIVGALSPHVPENWNPKKAFQLESLLMAQGYWAQVEAVSGLSAGYARCGRVQPLPDARSVELARGRAVTAAELWGDNAVWEVVEAPGGEWSPVSPTGLVVHDTLSARVHPRAALAALTAAVLARGGQIAEPVEGPTVWAVGVAEPGVAGVKGQAALFGYNAGDVPQLFVDGLHIIPHADGTVAVGSTSEREWSQPGPDELLDDVIARAREALPCLRGAEVIERWAGVRPRSKTRAPVLGAHPDRPGDYIVNGGFKIGFGMAPLVGEVMADLILDGVDRVPEAFRA